jgi:tRNA1(Val) A37 N6-methylase TrmN6
MAVCCSVSRVSSVFPPDIADSVICNPPYGIHGEGRISPVHERALSRTGDDLLGVRFIRAASHLLRTGGSFLMINLPSALPCILLGCETWSLNPVELQPVGPEGRPAARIVLRAVKGGGENLTIRPQLTADELLSGS